MLCIIIFIYLCIINISNSLILDQDLRPQFHFLPSSNWMNDPNGPFYDESTDIFHLMYQFETPRQWGHAISNNLIDWEILDIALNYSSAWYTEVTPSSKGVYSGSSSKIFNSFNNKNDIWLTISTPTNDMMLLAYPTNKSDPKLIDWSYVSNNPVIYANTTTINTIPYGRDPTEMWKCGNDNDQYCIGYATQSSEGCPCANVSGFIVFSSIYHVSSSNNISWSEWTNEGYLINDTNNAVMWECPDFYNLFNDTWLLKYSIGPGPSNNKPWGTEGPRDYYVTGAYNPKDITSFNSNINMFNQDMSRSENYVYDTGAFYASKTFNYQSNRILWGWNPEERPTNEYAEPYGWAGVMSLPRSIIPCKNKFTNSWYVKTPPVDFVIKGLRNISSYKFYSNINLNSNKLINLNHSKGQQIEILGFFNLVSNNFINNDNFGFKVLSSINTSTINNNINEIEEYTEIGIKYVNNSNISGIYIYVDTLYSCSNYSSIVNRSSVSTSVIKLNELNLNEDIEIRIIIDHSIIETYLNNGQKVITRRVYPSNPNKSINIQLFSSNAVNIINITTWNLRSANITTITTTTNTASDDDDDNNNNNNNNTNNNNTYFIEQIWIWSIIAVILIMILLFYNRNKTYTDTKRESLLSNRLLNVNK